MQKVLRETPLPPSALNVQLLPAMDAVVQKALAKNADERYQSATDVLRVLRGLSEDSFIAKPAPGRADPVPTPVNPSATL